MANRLPCCGRKWPSWRFRWAPARMRSSSSSNGRDGSLQPTASPRRRGSGCASRRPAPISHDGYELTGAVAGDGKWLIDSAGLLGSLPAEQRPQATGSWVRMLEQGRARQGPDADRRRLVALAVNAQSTCPRGPTPRGCYGSQVDGAPELSELLREDGCRRLRRLQIQCD